jgi:hypothetical protein
MTSPRALKCRFKRRQSAILRALITIALAVIAIQFSGVAEAFASQCCSSTADQCGDGQADDDGQPCQDCSPHCPQCRCTHGAFTTLLAPPPALVGEAMLQQTSDHAFDTQAPRAPPQPSLYRPPRHSLLSF